MFNPSTSKVTLDKKASNGNIDHFIMQLQKKTCSQTKRINFHFSEDHLMTLSLFTIKQMACRKIISKPDTGWGVLWQDSKYITKCI